MKACPVPNPPASTLRTGATPALPRQLGRVAHGEDLQEVTVHRDAVLGYADLGVEHPEDRVVLEQMSQGPRVRDVVHRHEVPVLALLLGGPEEVAADAPEPVDADLHAHASAPCEGIGSRPSQSPTR